MKTTIAAVAAFLVLAGNVAAQEAPWGNAEVTAYVEANRVAATPADPFAVPAAPTPPAAQVVLVYPARMMGTTTEDELPVTPTIKYDAAAQLMEVTMYPSSIGRILSLDYQGVEFARYSDRPKAFEWPTSEVTTSEDAGTGQNAYGAKVEMTRQSSVSRGFAEVAPGYDNPGPKPGGERYSTAFKHSWSIAPEDARALSTHLEMRVYGTTAPWSPGKNVICGSDYSGATVRNPTIRVVDACYLTGTVGKIELVDNRDGSVIRSWNR